MVIVASVMVALLALGCGKHQSDRLSAGLNASPAAIIDQSGGAPTGSPVKGEAAAEPRGQGPAAMSADSLPPDVVAAVADTLVVPGEVVEITAHGSPDVTEIILADGIGRRQAFARDAAEKVWRVLYRVPLRISAERVGLSVTARNESNRWRRVWIFLRARPEETQAHPDSVPGL